MIIYYSEAVELKDNTLIDDGICIWGHFVQYWNTHDIDTSNIVNGKPLHYWKNQISGTVPEGAGQVILGNCINVTVKNQVLSSCSSGIQLGFSSYNYIVNNTVSACSQESIHLNFNSPFNHITDNNVSYNYEGIRIYKDSNGNNITNNSVSSNSYGISIRLTRYNNITYNKINNNGYGIIIEDCSYNYIYHNIIMSSTFDEIGSNYWDNGYPSGGNYWFDYSGLDNFKGSNQDIPGKDGIGDSPYTDIQGGSGAQDNYPLLSQNISLENTTILKQGWNLISIPLIQKEYNLTRVLGSIESCYDAVRFYDNSDPTDPWKQTHTDKPFGNDLKELNEKMGFWIHVTRLGDTIFLYNGTTPTTSQQVQLHKGWNLVGYPSLTSYNRTDGLNNTLFGTHINKIMWYNATTQTWHSMSETHYFRKGVGYWIHTTEDIVWNVPL
jgi:parallel beta-helix repeat protein